MNDIKSVPLIPGGGDSPVQSILLSVSFAIKLETNISGEIQFGFFKNWDKSRKCTWMCLLSLEPMIHVSTLRGIDKRTCTRNELFILYACQTLYRNKTLCNNESCFFEKLSVYEQQSVYKTKTCYHFINCT